MIWEGGGGGKGGGSGNKNESQVLGSAPWPLPCSYSQLTNSPHLLPCESLADHSGVLVDVQVGPCGGVAVPDGG